MTKTKTQSGIYKITNKTNGKIYVGSAKNINKRWKRHIYELNNQKHHNIILQNAWNKYGCDNFKIEIIELIRPELLLKREQYYIDKLNPFVENGYNIAKITSGGDILTNNPKRDEIKDKISKSMKEMWKNKSDEEIKAYIDRTTGINSPSWNNGSSIKYCSCGKQIAAVNKCCRKCLDFSNNNNPFYGKKHTKEYKLASSIKRKGTYYGTQNKPIIIDEIEYKSIGEAAEKLEIKKLTVRYRVISNKEHFKNYRYK